MKWIVLLSLLSSCSSFADFVYMQETENQKTIQFSQNGSATTLNTDLKSWALYPDISADGKEFVYCEGTGPQDLHLTYENKSKSILQRFMLKDKGMLLHPKFSKNGQFIFYSAPGKNGKNTIFFFDRAAEVLRQGEKLTTFSLENAQVLTEGEEAYFPRPSSDGNFVIYQRNANGKKEIVLFDRLENEKKVLAEGMSPALSFDERTIAFTSKKSGSWNIYFIDRITLAVTEMTNDDKDEMAPTFTPTKELVFASNKSGHYELFQLEGSNWKTLMKTANADLYSPQFSGETTYAQKIKAPFIGNPRSSFGTVSHQGKIYMAGGHQGAEHTYPPESFTNTFLSYDIETNVWKELAPRPVFAHGYQIAAHGNYVYAFGGFAYSSEHKPKWKSLDQIHRYDIKENKWELVGKLNFPRSSNVAITINDKVYIAGGWDSTPQHENDAEGRFHDVIEIFDLSTEKLELANYKMPTPLRRAFTGVALDGKILLIGGLGMGASHFELIDNVTAIDPVTGETQEMSKLPFATFAPAAEVLGNELFVFGGMFRTGTMNFEYVSHIYGMKLDEKKWRHTGRYLKETKGFSQVFGLDEKTLGILGGHHYDAGEDRPVTTFESFSN